jgi:8-oxo-dGTP pyrophosphatase MutT (NUDIX family)
MSFGAANFVRVSQLRKLRQCEQVAAVCYRKRSGRIEFLLVQTRGSGRWTFPKGNTEPGLTHAQAAALEAFEEAGVHGRIEEASFTRYVRRERGAGSASSAIPTNVHLCEVSRLSTPQEAKRNRTWFSLQDAKDRLREGREDKEGAALARVVDRAAARIERQQSGANVNAADRMARASGVRDGLQKVTFEKPDEIYQRMERQSLLAYARSGMRRGNLSIGDVPPREVLQGEVLQFGLPRKKVKALGSGMRGH